MKSDIFRQEAIQHRDESNFAVNKTFGFITKEVKYYWCLTGLGILGFVYVLMVDFNFSATYEGKVLLIVDDTRAILVIPHNTAATIKHRSEIQQLKLKVYVDNSETKFIAYADDIVRAEDELHIDLQELKEKDSFRNVDLESAEYNAQIGVLARSNLFRILK